MSFWEYMIATGEWEKYMAVPILFAMAYIGDKLLKSKKKRDKEKLKQEIKEELIKEFQRSKP